MDPSSRPGLRAKLPLFPECRAGYAAGEGRLHLPLSTAINAMIPVTYDTVIEYLPISPAYVGTRMTAFKL